MELDVSHAVFLEPGPGPKLEWPELLVGELDRIPEDGVAQHFHREHADAFYVLEGKVVFEFAGEPVEASSGTFVLAPAGLVHGFRPPQGRFLNFHAQERRTPAQEATPTIRPKTAVRGRPSSWLPVGASG
jgi:glyoxylate utilization-related uncharacterized protein